MLIKRLIWIPVWWRNGKWKAIRIDLHKMVDIDEPECFHTHPAYAIRIVLSGGYFEEILSGCGRVRAFRQWEPGQVGLVRPSLCHRIADLPPFRASYSLWIRGPICANTELLGEGWKK